jgi:hypothetical protein
MDMTAIIVMVLVGMAIAATAWICSKPSSPLSGLSEDELLAVALLVAVLSE